MIGTALKKAKAGISSLEIKRDIDKTVKVSRLALEYAASVAGLFLTTECVIVKKPEKRGNTLMTPASDMLG